MTDDNNVKIKDETSNSLSSTAPFLLHQITTMQHLLKMLLDELNDTRTTQKLDRAHIATLLEEKEELGRVKEDLRRMKEEWKALDSPTAARNDGNTFNETLNRESRTCDAISPTTTPLPWIDILRLHTKPNTHKYLNRSDRFHLNEWAKRLFEERCPTKPVHQIPVGASEDMQVVLPVALHKCYLETVKARMTEISLTGLRLDDFNVDDPKPASNLEAWCSGRKRKREEEQKMIQDEKNAEGGEKRTSTFDDSDSDSMSSIQANASPPRGRSYRRHNPRYGANRRRNHREPVDDVDSGSLHSCPDRIRAKAMTSMEKAMTPLDQYRSLSRASRMESMDVGKGEQGRDNLGMHAVARMRTGSFVKRCKKCKGDASRKWVGELCFGCYTGLKSDG
ncbi:hypothetical protein BC829DRAFT_441169 [Chytridium lagenaria]|nr:hypothetical protein BC829DRAFT_441169 [Chytridium lagenaria]